MIAAVSFGENGPEMVPKVHTTTPERGIIVVVGPGGPVGEGISAESELLHAVEPFTDGSIAGILNEAFRPVMIVPLGGEARGPALEPTSGIRITNRDGDRVRLLSVGGLLQRGDPLGMWIRRELRDRLAPFETISSDAGLCPTAALNAAGACDSLVMLSGKRRCRTAVRV